MKPQSHSWLLLCRRAARRFVEDDCLQIAASLTFTTLLSMVPVLTIALTVVSVFPAFEPLIDQARQFVVANFMPSSVNAIAGYADQFSRNAAGLTTAGILFLGLTALMLIYTIESAFNDIWRVTWQRSVRRRILVYGAALTTGPLLIGASLSFTSYVVARSAGLVQTLPLLQQMVLNGAPLLLTVATFSLAYWAIPNRNVKARDAMLGGAVAGICFELMKHGFGFYVTHFPTDRLIYGAFALAPIFLLWIYLSWLIVFGGAVLVAVIPDNRDGIASGTHRSAGDFVHALCALEILLGARQGGEKVSTARLQATLRLKLDRLEWMMDTLSGAGIVARVGLDGWVLRCDPDRVQVADVYRLLCLDANSSVIDFANTRLSRKIQSLARESSAGMQLCLREFFESPDEAGDNAPGAA